MSTEETEEFNDVDEPESAEPGTATIQPARTWPQYNVDRARAELIAMEMLLRGASHFRVRQTTKLSSRNVRRLAQLLAEEAMDPPAPRNVCRRPVHSGGQPYQRKTGEADAESPAEPEQLALLPE
ncbi:hypothetical protein [Streptomyces nanshensis]|uniref:hypothetical protein n=1 Tax=Streptomyces nanshensis TaxID=518642 RepID=UPI00085C7FCF|nr:hypothetical protein [Streptomyces nanshensis]